MKKSQLWAGILSPPIALGGIGAAILINRSWWRLTNNAISDLGKVGLPHSWVMNVPLFISAVLAIYYVMGLFKEVKNPVSKLGIGVFILGLAFLAGIAVFPEGTEPHYHVSWGFFLAGSVGFLIAGASLWLEGRGRFGAFTVLLFTAEVLLARWAFKTFSGVAIAEFTGIFAMIIWHYALLWSVVRPKRLGKA
ncbi:DUF998 domain-containing protein [Thermococcus aciditolerans]|uniref:DUF998 domain-containing protein n=1 Tax=Thermococcus aciditolerans TaxID=2598455 RepID=A0A5C0SIP5_9EURY|nr:DUF998 domain-containing protein [Thermococcus aciditolerans]QEK13872.1 DUF998 domain-containing protein [Thermococcus aciditolerans]